MPNLVDHLFTIPVVNPAIAQSGQVEEPIHVARELLGVLVQEAMAGIREDLQAGIGHLLLQDEAVDGGDHEVVGALGDEGGRRDVGEAVERAVGAVGRVHPRPPRGHHAHDGGAAVLVAPRDEVAAFFAAGRGVAFLQAGPEGLAGRLAGRGRTEEELVQTVVEAGRGLAGQSAHFVVLFFRVVDDAFSRAGTRPGDDEFADEAGGTVQVDERRDEAAHAEAEHVDFLDLDELQELDDMLGHLARGRRHGPGAFPNSCVVEEDDRTFSGNRVDQQWIPEIHIAPEMDQEDHGHCSFGRVSEATVCISNLSCIRILRLGGLVCLGHVCSWCFYAGLWLGLLLVVLLLRTAVSIVFPATLEVPLYRASHFLRLVNRYNRSWNEPGQCMSRSLVSHARSLLLVHQTWAFKKLKSLACTHIVEQLLQDCQVTSRYHGAVLEMPGGVASHLLIGRLRIRPAKDIVIHSNHQHHRSWTMVSGDNISSSTEVIGLEGSHKVYSASRRSILKTYK